MDLENSLRLREKQIAEMHAENRRLAELADLASARASAAEAAPRGLEASEQATRIFLDRIFETPADLEGFLSTYYPAVARGATLRADRISALMNQPRSNLINLIRRRFPAREATNRHLLGG